MHAAAHTHATYRRHRAGRRVLPLFILVSAAVHALLFATWHASLPAVGSHGPITITLAAEPAAARAEPVSRNTPAAEPAAAPKTATQPPQRPTRAAVSGAPAAAARGDNVIAVESVANDGAAPEVRESAAATAIAARVNLELARHFHYPPQAVRRGWQGTVLLGFRVGIDGDIEDIHITQSSGHALLDRAALGALGKVQKLALDSGTLRAALDLQLPVIYRLEES